MTDLDPRAGGIGQLHFSGVGVTAQQLIFNRPQRFDHLSGQEKFGPLLRLGYR